MIPHIVLDDPSLFTVVTLNMYSNPAFTSGILTDVASTLMSGMGMGISLFPKRYETDIFIRGSPPVWM